MIEKAGQLLRRFSLSTRNSKLLHARVECCTFYSQTSCCSSRTVDNAIRLPQRPANKFALCIPQSGGWFKRLKFCCLTKVGKRRTPIVVRATVGDKLSKHVWNKLVVNGLAETGALICLRLGPTGRQTPPVTLPFTFKVGRQANEARMLAQ